MAKRIRASITNHKQASLVKDHQGKFLIKIQFPYDINTITKIRALYERKYIPKLKIWTAPLHIETIDKLLEYGFVLDSHLDRFKKGKDKRKLMNLKALDIHGLKGELRPYQKEGVAWIEYTNGKTLIADEMGLGKTIQTLAWVHYHPDRRPVLIVCPLSAKLNWKCEIEKWLPDAHTEILNGNKPWVPSEEFLIINYDILPKWAKMLKSLSIQILITDECHYYKNSKALRTKAIKNIGKSIPYILALSGTPIVNRPQEIYNVIKLLKPALFPNFMEYGRRFCGAVHTRFGWDFSGATNTQELHEILINSIMIRRLKKDVLKELPDKIHSYVPFELDNKSEYIEAENNFIEWLRAKKGDAAANRASNAEQVAVIEALKQLAVKGALKSSIDWIKDSLENQGKLVVFATHKFVIASLMEEFGNKIAVKIDGSVSEKKRHQAVIDFQNNPDVRLFVGNIQAAGTAITLTAASNVAFLELPWTPGELWQAIDRLHRITQTEVVNVYYLFAVNTIMERTAHLIDTKQKILSKVLDGGRVDNISLLTDLINEYLK